MTAFMVGVAALVAALGIIVFEWQLHRLKARLRQTERDVAETKAVSADNDAAVDTLLEHRRRQLVGKQAQ